MGGNSHDPKTTAALKVIKYDQLMCVILKESKGYSKGINTRCAFFVAEVCAQILSIPFSQSTVIDMNEAS